MQIKNSKQLSDKLAEWLEQLEAGKLQVGVAKEFFNGAGKMINANKVQLDYNDKMKNGQKIDFFEIPKEV